MILRDLTPDEMASVEKIGTVRKFAAGDCVIREGEAGSTFFLILEGRVEVRKNIGLDKFKRLTELGPLDIVGEVCFLGVESRSASVLAREVTLVMEFGRSEFEKLITQRPAIGLKLYRGIACELAQRLTAANAELRDAIVWGLGGGKTSTEPAIDTSRKLALMPPVKIGVSARIVKS